MDRKFLEDQFRTVYEAAFGVRPVFTLGHLSNDVLHARTVNTAQALMGGRFRTA